MNQRDVQPEIVFYTNTNVDISPFVQSIDIWRSKKNPVATAQIVLNPSIANSTCLTQSNVKIVDYWQTVLKKYNILSIKMDKKDKKHKFLGFITHIYPRVSANNQNTSRELVINCGLLISTALINDNLVMASQLSNITDIKNDPVLGPRAEFFKFTRGYGKDGSPFVGKEPQVAVQYILEHMIATGTTVQQGSGSNVTLQSFFPGTKQTDIDGKPMFDFNFLDYEQLYNPNLSTYTGTLLNYIYQCLDMAWYEAFFDTSTGTDGMPYNKFVIRSKPYSYKGVKSQYDLRKKWVYMDDLASYTVNSDQRIFESLGTNILEYKNFWQVYYAMSLIAAPNTTAATFGVNLPVINIEGVKKYGLRDLVTTSTILNIEEVRKEYNVKQADSTGITMTYAAAQQSKLFESLLDKREKMIQWTCFPNFYSGQLTVIGGEYDLDKAIFYEDQIYTDPDTGQKYKGVAYLIDSITDSYRIGQMYTTTLGLVRGAPNGFMKDWLNKNRSKFISIDTFEQRELQPGLSYSVDIKDTRDRRATTTANMLPITEVN